jgi:hypothetical protein
MPHIKVHRAAKSPTISGERSGADLANSRIVNAKSPRHLGIAGN